jgi:hypothetical protein
MPDWKRTTKEVPFESLPPGMVAAIRQHIEQYNLGPILSEALMCVQTDSEKLKKSLFGKAETVRTAAIVTPRWLVWATDGAKTGVAVLSGQLIHLTVRDYAQTPFAKMVPDSGIEVGGLPTDTPESVSAFIGLENGRAGQRFKEVVIKAAADAKK